MSARASLRRNADAAADAARVLARLAERLHLTVTGLVAVALLVGGWIGARAAGSRTMYLMVYAGAVTILIAWLWTRRRLSLAVHRSQLPTRMRVGQRIPVGLQITTERRLTTLMLEEHVPANLGRSVRIPIGRLRPGDVIEHQYVLRPTLRGVYQVGPVTATWNDPFGFTVHRQELPEAAEIIVHPPTEQVHDRVLTRMWEDPPVRPPVSKPWPVGFEFYGMRDYVPGDDLRRVVWSALAKSGRVMVRESEQGITDRVLIHIDNDGEWHSPGDVSETFETAVRAAASLGVRHLKDGFTVSLLTNDGELGAGFRGMRAEIPFLDELARVQRTSAPLAEGTRRLLEQARSHPHVILITPHLDASEAQHLKLVTERGISAIVVHVVWEESDLLSGSRAVAVGARVLQLEPGAPLEAVFQGGARAGSAR